MPEPATIITMTVREGKLSKSGAASGGRPPDYAEAWWGPVLFQTQSANGASMRLARELVAAGCPDQPWQAVGEDGQRRFFGKSLHRLAKLTLAEGADAALRFAPYVEYPTPLFGRGQDGAEPDYLGMPRPDREG